VSRAIDSEWFDVVPGETATIRVHSNQVGGRFSIVDSLVMPNAGPPLHSHREEEIFEVLEGVVTFVCGEDRFEASSGSMVVIPAGAAHLFANFSGAPVRLRTIFLPGGPEQIMARVAGLSPTELSEMATSYGTKVLGPPLTA
jgi:mannose-6-phosphate isomerase-like protein (cupin superfamily)